MSVRRSAATQADERRAQLSAVDAVVQAGGAEVPARMAQVEARMAAAAGGHGAALARFGGETIAAGGKRLRPLLVFLSAGVPVPDSDGLVRAAAAVELVHSATLVHDDVLDGAALRRGRPTVAAAGGRLMATATGDFLFSRAFSELAGSGSVAAVRILARASAELAAGELMQREDAYDAQVTIARYLERCRLKTAVLFRAAGELGGLFGDPDGAALGAFGEQIGLAFQILDDVLDVTGPPERTGKPRGADLLDGTVTLPFILARERDPELAAVDPRSVLDAARAAKICDQIAATGALALARERAMGFVAGAKALLAGLPSPQRGALELVADGVVERYS